MNKLAIQIVLTITGAVILLGFLLPALFSAQSTEAVLGGVLIVAGLGAIALSKALNYIDKM